MPSRVLTSDLSAKILLVFWYGGPTFAVVVLAQPNLDSEASGQGRIPKV